jgi:hypothetical protein
MHLGARRRWRRCWRHWADFCLKQGFHSSCGGAGNFLEPELPLLLGRAGNFLGARASTQPAAERVTSFFTRVKKEVTKKENTLRGAPGFTLGDSERLCRSQLRVRRDSVRPFTASHFIGRHCFLYRRYCLTAACVLQPGPVDWDGVRPRRFSGRKTWGADPRAFFW